MGIYESDLGKHRSGVVPDNIKRVNREEHKCMLDMQILGLLISRYAAEGVDGCEFETFVRRHLDVIRTLSKEHPVDVGERIAKVSAKYQFR